MWIWKKRRKEIKKSVCGLFYFSKTFGVCLLFLINNYLFIWSIIISAVDPADWLSSSPQCLVYCSLFPVQLTLQSQFEARRHVNFSLAGTCSTWPKPHWNQAQHTALMQIVPYDIKTAQFVTESVSDFPALFLSHCERGLIHTYSLAYLFSASHSCLLPSPQELTQS